MNFTFLIRSKVAKGKQGGLVVSALVFYTRVLGFDSHALLVDHRGVTVVCHSTLLCQLVMATKRADKRMQ